MRNRNERRLLPGVLDRLLEAEAWLRRHRQSVGPAIAAMIIAIALADAWVWPGISFAFGYALPITLGAYVFGSRAGVLLSLLAVILRRVCAGRAYGPWWLYAGSALMLTEYLTLAVGVGLLGRVVRRFERHTRVLGELSLLGRELTVTLDPQAILRQAVEGEVRLTGTEVGFVATRDGAAWQTDAVLARGRWHCEAFVWWPYAAAPWETPHRGRSQLSTRLCDPGLRRLGAQVQLAVPIHGHGTESRLALVVFRAERRMFARPTREVLGLLALHVAAALKTAALYRTAAEATGEKARMLAAVAHDLRSPLHALLWDTDTLRSAQAGPRRELERMTDNAALALELVATLQTFAEIENRQLAVRPEPVSLGRVFEDLRAMMEPLLAGRPIAFEARIAPGAETVVTDAAHLCRTLANLLSNAAKFTERGTIELTAARSETETTIAIRDTGVGIDPAELPKLFSPFYRGAVRALTPLPGMGLGLAIAHELTKLLGSRIEVESEVGQGSTFRVRLPVSGPPEAPATSAIADQPALPASSSEGYAMLVLDDGPR